MVALSYNASTQGTTSCTLSEVYDQPQLRIKFKASLYYMKP